jgi:predicted alpha-1,2-mannosidase
MTNQSTFIHLYSFLKLKVLILLTANLAIAQVDYSKSVNPFIGTDGHGHTFPGAVFPFGMVQLSPDTRIDGSWDGCGGYHYSDSLIYGFSHTHLSGTGVSDWGDILLMPANENKGNNNRVYANGFTHKNETAHAGYYSVKLNNGIQTKLTTTERAGIHSYEFPGSKAYLFIDLLHRDKTIDCYLEMIDSFTVKGYRKSEAWAKEQHCYFTLKSNKKIKNIQSKTGFAYSQKKDFEKKNIIENTFLEFDNTDKLPLIIKVGISGTDNDGSSLNLQKEAPHWDFETYKRNAEKAWQQQLGKITIDESDTDKRSVFYTALYHCFIHPSLDMDVDGRYRGRDNQIHTATGYTHYNVFSLWDTYRALHPLFTLIEQNRTIDFIKTFYAQYTEGKKLPVWELSSNETNCMIGYHSVSVIADAYMKGIKNFDTLALYKAMLEASQTKEFGIDKFYRKSFLEINDESESVSKSLEYAYDNWCIAIMGKQLNQKNNLPQLFKSAQAYKNLFDATTGFMRPRINGNWLSPFFPQEINNHFTEGNSWHYSFYVPHDISGLIKLHGGKLKLETKLDAMFNASSKTTGRTQVDVTGLIGQYAHGNEPSHHVPFLYNYTGNPNKTAMRVHKILNDFYTNTPEGLIGNDDCGQMSAWYVLASLGMYQVCPGNPEFVIFQPLFQKAELRFENGNVLAINNASEKNKVVSAIVLNEQRSEKSFLSFNDITRGGNLRFEYTLKTTPQNKFGTGNNAPVTTLNDYPLVPTPIIEYKNKTFNSTQAIKLKAINEQGLSVAYSTSNQLPTRKSKKYVAPLTIRNTTLVRARAYSKTDSSELAVAALYKLNTKYIVKLQSTPNKQYSAEGGQSMVDGIYGDTDWRKGDWLGFQGQDLEVIVELKESESVKNIGLNCLQDTRSWIVFPKKVTFLTSTDGNNYQNIGSLENTVPADDYNIQIRKFNFGISPARPIRFIKVIAQNFGTLPEWHDGRGFEAFIFADEITIE